MSTALYDKIIFGPIHSRRLGISLGVNLLSPESKHCNFDCIYCECGWNRDHPHGHFNPTEQVVEALEAQLQQMATEGLLPEVITFAGNGEPTMHPDFGHIVELTRALRERLAPRCKIAVLTNATMIHRPAVVAALRTVDDNILKFDSAIESTVRLMNQPNNPRTTAQTIELLRQFSGTGIVQTMFLRSAAVDNTTPAEVEAWLAAIAQIAPAQVMLYSIDRDTPQEGLEAVTKEQMELIAQRVRALGIKATVN
ncbi:MAG: radical SAM protein [Mucinivorans sp.]